MADVFALTLTPKDKYMIEKDSEKGSVMDVEKDRKLDREIPYLPPEMIENITRLLIQDFHTCKECMYYEQCNESIYDNEYTLLNLFIVFPYLLRQIKDKFCSHKISLYIYNFVYIKIDNVFDKLVTLVETFKDIYSLDMWLAFITCDHSPFYNTNEGIAFVNYILSKYSNHQQKKISNYLLCNLLNYHTIIPISKSLDNIIFNKLVYHFKNTKKLNISLLTIEEKYLLLSYIASKSINILYKDIY